jgi:peptidoglycan/LPS O-acetylase OafA/YrhL
VLPFYSFIFMPIKQGNKLLAFDGLRGLAALVVLVYHLRLAFFPSTATYVKDHLGFMPWPFARFVRLMLEGLSNGSFSVYIFWVMSAFVLALQFFNKSRLREVVLAHDYLENATLRRFPRLLIPVLASVMFAYGLMSLGLMYNHELTHLLTSAQESVWLSNCYNFKPGFWDALLAGSWSSFFDYGSSSTYNNVLWTMKPELFGSLFLFSFLGLFGHGKIRIFLYPVLAVFSFYLRVFWLESFIAGILLCDLYVNLPRIPAPSRWLGSVIIVVRRNSYLSALAWSFFILLAGLRNYGGVLYTILAFFAISFAVISAPSQRLLSTPPVLFLGKISFGLYLVHVPVICSFSSWLYIQLLPLLSASLVISAVVMLTALISVGLGAVFFWCFDSPSIVISKKFASKLIKFSMSG